MGQPGVAKTRPRKYRHEAHDGHEHVEARWGEPRCTQCGELAAWANDPRVLREGEMRDGRWALKVPLPTRILQLNAPLVREFDRTIAASALHHTTRRLLRLYLRYADWLTGVVYRNPKHMYLHAEVEKRRAQVILKAAKVADLVRRSSAPSRALSDVPHLHYDAHDDRLRGVNPDAVWDPRYSAEEWRERRYGFHEHKTGARWTEWMPMSVGALTEALDRLTVELGQSSESRKKPGARKCERDRRVDDLHDRRVDDLHDRRVDDPRDHPFHRQESLSLDPDTLGSEPLQNAPLDPSRIGGTSSETASAPPTEEDAPSAPGPMPPSAGDETASPGTSGCEGRGSKNQTGVARPGAAQGRERAFLIPPATAAETATVSALVLAGMEALPRQQYPGPLRDLLVKHLRRGAPLEELEAFVIGVTRGEGDAAAARAPHVVAPFHYAAKTWDLYVHAGRAARGDFDGPTEDVRERLSEIRAKAASPPKPEPKPERDEALGEAIRAANAAYASGDQAAIAAACARLDALERGDS